MARKKAGRMWVLASRVVLGGSRFWEVCIIAQLSPAQKQFDIRVVVQVAIQKPGFFEEAGLLWANLYHYRYQRPSRTQLRADSAHWQPNSVYRIDIYVSLPQSGYIPKPRVACEAAHPR